jgi:hypothetical protein
MCRYCFVVNFDFIVPPIPSRYRKGEYLSPDPIVIRPGDVLFNRIPQTNNVYERIAIFEHAVDLVGSTFPESISNRESETSLRPLYGIDGKFFELERAINYLSEHNPKRLKVIEQLEMNYYSGIDVKKNQRNTAISTLQTRQSLEMDILINSNTQGKDDELKMLVAQHYEEIETVEKYWNQIIQEEEDRCLNEFIDLVLEVYTGEMNNCAGPSSQLFYQQSYKRPDGMEWISLSPVAVVKRTDYKTRLVRVTKVRVGDYMKIFSREDRFKFFDRLDPEELVLETKNGPVIGAVLGASKSLDLKSNQDVALLKLIGSDCRWPSLRNQFESIRKGIFFNFFVTRHSNINTSFIFHIVDDEEASIGDIIQFSDHVGIDQLYIPLSLVPDVNAPSVDSGFETEEIVVESVRSRLDNVFPQNKRNLKDIFIVDTKT